MLLIRFSSALLSAGVFAFYLPNPAMVVWRFRCGSAWYSPACEEQYLWANSSAIYFQWLVAFIWLAAWALLELKARGSLNRGGKLLTHLRYGPIAILLISIAAILLADMFLIQYSRWQIVRYIHSSASPQDAVSFRLHNDYRHWCGNGIAAQQYANYDATPAAYFDNPDPAVRARALRASMAVYDWLNFPRDGPSLEVLAKAKDDPDPFVRQLADEYECELVPMSN